MKLYSFCAHTVIIFLDMDSIKYFSKQRFVLGLFYSVHLIELEETCTRTESVLIVLFCLSG